MLQILNCLLVPSFPGSMPRSVTCWNGMAIHFNQNCCVTWSLLPGSLYHLRSVPDKGLWHVAGSIMLSLSLTKLQHQNERNLLYSKFRETLIQFFLGKEMVLWLVNGSVLGSPHDRKRAWRYSDPFFKLCDAVSHFRAKDICATALHSRMFRPVSLHVHTRAWDMPSARQHDSSSPLSVTDCW
jgi:hypothetical protein